MYLMHVLRLLSLALLAAFPSVMAAQHWFGIQTDNFAPIVRMQAQPAALADMPFRWTVLPFGANLSVANLRLVSTMKAVLSTHHLTYGDEERILAHADVQLPSFAMRLGERSAIGLQWRLKGWAFTETTNYDFFSLLESGFDQAELIGTNYTGDRLAGTSQIFNEITPTFAFTLYRDPIHKLKAGVGFKMLIALASGSLHAEDLSFSYAGENSLAQLSGRLSLRYNEQLQTLIDEDRLSLSGKFSMGLDFGMEYQWMPDKRTYRLRLGVSLLQLGRLRYSTAEESATWSVEGKDIDLNTLINANSLQELQDSLSSLFDKTPEGGGNYSVPLPARLAFQADYAFSDHFFANLSALIPMTRTTDDMVRPPNFATLVLTPRVEFYLWSLQLPVYYHELEGVQAGISGRIGPVFLGLPNIFTAPIGDFEHLRMYLGVRFGSPFEKRSSIRSGKNWF